MPGRCSDNVEGYGLMLPCAVMIRARVLGAVLVPGLLLGAALLPGCFSSCTGKPAAPAAPAAQTPVSPMPAPVVQTPTAPPPGPAVQTPEAPPPPPPEEPKKEEPPKPTLTLENMRAVREGMTQLEVQEKMGVPGALIAGTDQASVVYRWNQAGLSFLAKFENGKLIRKSIITPLGDEVPTEKVEGKTIDKDLYNGIRAGMSFDEVMGRIGIEAQPISKNSENVNIYTWRDSSGSSFTARFENDKLVKKSGLFVAKGKGKGKAEEEQAEGERPPEPNTRTAEDNAEEAAGNADDGMNGAEDNAEQAAGGTETDTAETAPPAPRKGRVTVAGASRREREAEKGGGKSGSYRPRAQLPQNMLRLPQGSYEIRVRNAADTRVKAAVVSQEGSTELTIPPGGKQSVFVNQGDYVVNFIYDDDPYTLHRGGVIPIGQWLTDMEVFLYGDTYNVQVLDKSRDKPQSRENAPNLKSEFRR